LLDTLPGVGPLLAAVIWGEVGDLQRSPSAEALVNYTGLIPSLYQSGEVKVQGHIHPPGFGLDSLGADHRRQLRPSDGGSSRMILIHHADAGVGVVDIVDGTSPAATVAQPDGLAS